MRKERTIKLWRNKGAERVWQCELEREKSDSPPSTLRLSTWTKPATEWAGVTPWSCTITRSAVARATWRGL
jgi:hypothetical protein